jgi:hypothetical protein
MAIAATNPIQKTGKIIAVDPFFHTAASVYRSRGFVKVSKPVFLFFQIEGI